MSDRKRRSRYEPTYGRRYSLNGDYPFLNGNTLDMDLAGDAPDRSEEVPERSKEEEARLKEIQEGPMRTELKHIDQKISKKGHIFYEETVEDKIPEQVNWWDKFALCLVRTVRTLHKEDVCIKTSLQVNSQHLKDILKKTVHDYPGVSFATKNITIDKPYHVLFHWRQELEDAHKELEEGSEAAEHLKLLLNFIRDEFKDCISETENL